MIKTTSLLLINRFSFQRFSTIEGFFGQVISVGQSPMHLLSTVSHVCVLSDSYLTSYLINFYQYYFQFIPYRGFSYSAVLHLQLFLPLEPHWQNPRTTPLKYFVCVFSLSVDGHSWRIAPAWHPGQIMVVFPIRVLMHAFANAQTTP